MLDKYLDVGTCIYAMAYYRRTVPYLANIAIKLESLERLRLDHLLAGL
jgi:hypothetical protein